MELNKEIQEILLDFEILSQENEWTKEQKEIRSVYDTFRIQNIINSTIPVVSHRRELLFCDFCKEENPHKKHEHKKLKECEGCGLITKL